MAEIVKTMKLHIHPQKNDIAALTELTESYRVACNFVSCYIFDHGFPLNSVELSKLLYQTLRTEYGLKSQLAQSCIKTVIARYKTIKDQLFNHPYSYQEKDESRQYITRTLDWLQRSALFSRPQADFVRNRDYSFVDGGSVLSLNTLQGRIRVSFDVPECFKDYFDGSWKFGTGKIVSLLGEWYLHVPMSKEYGKEYSSETVKHVVGIDRGLRFLATTYDEQGTTTFFDGKTIMQKREAFQAVRSEAQSRGTKSAKRVLKRVSGRENRWMTDVNHRITKTLVTKYGQGTLFVLEDLTGVSFNEENISQLTKTGRRKLRSWSFYQMEQMLTYKAHETASEVIRIKPDYTSQRCPKCGRVRKENRHHDIHEYICDCCGYRSNDDRIGAMNIQLLGTFYVSGDTNPKLKHKEN